MVSMIEVGKVNEKILKEEEFLRLKRWHKEVEYKMKMYCGGDIK